MASGSRASQEAAKSAGRSPCERDAGTPCGRPGECVSPFEGGVGVGGSLPCERPRPSTSEKVVATLDPPDSYWPAFRDHWVASEGQSSFGVAREALLQKIQADGFVYVCLCLQPVEHTFPVVSPHVSLGAYQFEGFHQNWRAYISCQALLWPRNVRADLFTYGPTNFKLGQGCELHALVSLLKDCLKAECVSCRDVDVDPHISWTSVQRALKKAALKKAPGECVAGGKGRVFG